MTARQLFKDQWLWIELTGQETSWSRKRVTES